MIPRTFHWIWLGGEPLSPQHEAWMQQWRDHHPGWEFKLWRDTDSAEIVPASFKPLYDRAQSLAGKSDIARLWIIYRHGGIYLDVDRSCLKPIDELLEGCEAFAAISMANGTVTNNIFGAAAGNPFIRQALDEFPAHFDSKRPNKSGPLMMTKIARERGDVRIFEQRIFSPVEYKDRARLDARTEFPGSFSVHYFEASWVKSG